MTKNEFINAYWDDYFVDVDKLREFADHLLPIAKDAGNKEAIKLIEDWIALDDCEPITDDKNDEKIEIMCKIYDHADLLLKPGE